MDRPLKVSRQVAYAEFAKLGVWPNISRTDMRNFVTTFFDLAGSDLDQVIPVDYRTVQQGGLPLYHDIADHKLQGFASQVHSRWRDLGRKVSPLLQKLNRMRCFEANQRTVEKCCKLISVDLC